MRNVYRIWLKKLVTVFICMGLFVPFFGFAVTAEETVNEVNPSQAPEQSDENSEANFNASSDSSLDEERLTISISNLTGPAYVMENRVDDENPDLTNFQFQFRIDCTELGGFQAGDEISVNTNLGQWFNADWENPLFSNYVIYAEDGKTPMATISIGSDTIRFKIEDESFLRTVLQGIVTIPAALSAMDTPEVTPTHFETREIYIGEAQCLVEFREESRPTGTGGDGQPGLSLPDVDRFWKNYGTITVNGANTNGASAWMQINPIGAMDLYGSTTYDGPRGPRRPVQYTNLTITDKVPVNGHIDLSSVMICAAINGIKVNEGNDFTDQWHGDETGNYDIPHGTYYAERWENRISIKDRMTQLTQIDGETYDQFLARVKSEQLQWGVYIDTTGTETFVCNLGNIGTEDNNGISYSEFAPDYVKNYPEIFGAEGASHGNVVSYYIEFKTYAPNINHVLSEKVTNPGRWSADSAYREGHGTTTSTSGGTDA